MNNNDTSRTGRNFIGVSLVIFMSKLLGFARDIVFAFVFGTNALTDAFQVIFSFPSLLFSSIGTALSSVNIPDLTYYIKERTPEERNAYLSNIFAHISLWATVVAVAGIVFAPALTRLVAGGLSDEVLLIAEQLTRIMMPTLLFVTLCYITAGVLQVHGYFIISAAISIPFNLIIIAALLGKGTDIIFLGYVTTIGWFLQFLVQVPVLVKEKYRFHWRLDFHEEHTVNMFRQLVPILLGNALLQLCLIIDRTFATNLEKGTAAALAFGSNLFITITSVFIVAMSTVVFPRLSQYCLERDHAGTRSLLNLAFKILLFILLPYLILVVAYHREIITLVYQRGAFTAYSTSMTSLAFLLYSLAVPGYACQELFNRVFYALKKFKVPALASVFCLVIKLLADWFSYRWAGIAGISISTSFCLLLYAVIMSFMVRKEIGSFLSRDLARFCCKLAFPALAMVSVVWGGEYIINSSSRFIFLIPLLLGAGAYLGLACLLGMRRDFATREV